MEQDGRKTGRPRPRGSRNSPTWWRERSSYGEDDSLQLGRTLSKSMVHSKVQGCGFVHCVTFNSVCDSLSIYPLLLKIKMICDSKDYWVNKFKCSLHSIIFFSSLYISFPLGKLSPIQLEDSGFCRPCWWISVSTLGAGWRLIGRPAFIAQRSGSSQRKFRWQRLGSRVVRRQ